MLVEIGRLYARQHAFEQALQHFAAALTDRGSTQRSAAAHRHLRGAVGYLRAGARFRASPDLPRSNIRRSGKRSFNTRHQYRLMTLQTIAHRAAGAQRSRNLPAKNVALQYEIQEKEQALVELDAFASMVAHDLKSPLSTIIAYCELVIRDFLLPCRMKPTSSYKNCWRPPTVSPIRWMIC